MSNVYKVVEDGTVTSAQGFLAGAVKAGIKTHSELDLALLYSEIVANTAGVFTTATIKSAPVLVTKEHIKDQKAQAVIVNSGCANACLGKRGLDDAVSMARAAANKLQIDERNIIVSSTGVIGVPLPMEKILSGISSIELSREGGAEFARAIMTTDTRVKQRAVQTTCSTGTFILGGATKGAGMIHPDMATMLCYLTTDAAVESNFLQMALQKAVDLSFNMITVDGDTSPSDTVILMANGMAGNEPFNEMNGDCFQQALDEVCVYLAKCIARDGEGATRLIEVSVEGAETVEEAKVAARTVAGSNLVKAAIHGNDPNWGRIAAAIGRSGISVIAEKLDIYINDVCVMKHGSAAAYDEVGLSTSMAQDNGDVFIKVSINTGECSALSWGCDLSQEYVTINSDYTT